MTRTWVALLLFAIGCGGSPSLSGINLPARALGSPAARASFGQSVAILGGEVAIGAPAEDGGARDAGQVHVFDRFDGTFQRTLTSPAPITAGRFGTALAADAGRILVGEPGRGRAYVIDAATGSVVATLTGPGDFGSAVALGGGSACVGAPSRGEVHVFDAATGSLRRVIARPGALGSALAIADGSLLAGAPGAGRAYVFDLAAGDEILSLSGPEDFGAAVAAAGGSWLVAAPEARRAFLYDSAGALLRTFLAPGFADAFGTGVALDGDHVIVGGLGGGVPSLFVFDFATGALARTIQSSSPNEGLSLAALSGVALVGLFPIGTAPRPGVAQTFSCDSGGLLQTFESPGDVPQGALGTSVLVVGALTAVGAPGEGTGGLVHLFADDGTIVRTLASPNAQAGGGFGTALAKMDTLLAVGAPGESIGGRVHVFDTTDGSFVRTLAPSGQSSPLGFGSAIAIGAGMIFVGSPGDVVVVQSTIPGAGSVYPFALATGTAGQPIVSPNPTTNGSFGTAVAATDSEILVGAPGEASGEGRAHVIDAASLQLSTTLFGSPANAGAFGTAVAITQDFYWVGAPNEDVFDQFQQPHPGAGAVHAFAIQGKLSDTVLHSATFPQQDGHFGASLVTGDGFAVVGAPDEPILALPPTIGAAYLFDAQSLRKIRRFVSPQSGANVGDFGAAVAVDTTRVIVGAPLEDRGPSAPDAGLAYLFNPNAVASLTSPQVTDTGFFGWDVATLDSDTVVIGAPFEDTGNVYLVDPNGVQPIITIPGGQSGGEFGWSVAVAAGNIAVSAPSDNLGQGAAYLYDPLGNLLATFASPDANAFGFGDEIAGVGINVLVGSPDEALQTGETAGRAYLFSAAGTLLTTFTSPNPEDTGEFGASVGSFGTDVLIGAPGENGGVGRAYLFQQNGTLIRTFNGPEANARFGASVGAVTSGLLAGQALEVAVGAPGTSAGGSVTTFDAASGAVTGNVDNPEPIGEPVQFGESFVEVNGLLAVGSPFGGFAQGRVFLFGAGQLVGSIGSPNAQVAGQFGLSIAAFGGDLLVGAPSEDVNPLAAGRAYVVGAVPQSQGPQPDAVFQSPNPVPGGAFGSSVSFAGGAPVVGAPGEDEGVVYVFDPQTLQPDVALQSPTPVTGARFGEAIGANFLQITVGEPGGAGGAGRAYLYDASTNLLRLVFDTSFPETGGLFGASVAVTGANSVVGAPGEDVGGVANAGRAYYFDCLTESVLQVFEPPNPTDDGRFGCAVATVAFDVFVGACDEGAGNVYRFFGLSGEMLDTYPHPDPQTGAQFGFALAMAGTNLLVGAPNQIVGQADSAGTAYLIDTATGTVLQTFTKPVPAAGDRLGSAVAAMGSRIFVGAPGALQGAGEVWEFDATSGAPVARYESSNPQAGGLFGAALATIPDNGLVGAPGEDGGDAGAGRAYLNPPPQ